MDGENNIVTLKEPINFYNSNIIIHGNNNKIFIDGTIKKIQSLYVDCGQNLSNRILHIKKDLYTEGVEIYMYGNKSRMIIGEDCMFSNNIRIFTSDGHRIVNEITGETLNKNRKVYIGNHVWLGRNCTICKNVTISDNSIVGTGSIVTKKFYKPNIIIAGNPAKEIKSNINWESTADF